jgi:hypothetical protein
VWRLLLLPRDHAEARPAPPRSESVMKSTAGTWEVFGELLGRTTPGNGGACAFHYTHPEITPHGESKRL